MNKQQKEIELSIIILTYDSESQLPLCLDSIYKYNHEKLFTGDWELIVIDNNSSDQTVPDLKKSLPQYPNLTLIENRENLGFGPANNLAAKKAGGKFVLFLNPDTELERNSVILPLQYLQGGINVGAVSPKLVLGNGQIDMTCHRGFPTPWNSFCYFSGLSKLFPQSKLFSGYTLGNLNFDKPHDVDAISGAYFLMPKSLGQQLKFFDPAFFWKGEDLDFCYRIKEKGYKIMYLPQASVHHYKGSSHGHKRGSKTLQARFEVMRLFYDKHYQNKYPFWMRSLVLAGVKLRYLMAYLTGK